jgi:hypothetical protein
MKKIQYFILIGLCLLCFTSLNLMIRDCQNLSLFQFTFLWICMSMSALIGLVILKSMEGK